MRIVRHTSVQIFITGCKQLLCNVIFISNTIDSPALGWPTSPDLFNFRPKVTIVILLSSIHNTFTSYVNPHHSWQHELRNDMQHVSVACSQLLLLNEAFHFQSTSGAKKVIFHGGVGHIPTSQQSDHPVVCRVHAPFNITATCRYAWLSNAVATANFCATLAFTSTSN